MLYGAECFQSRILTLEDLSCGNEDAKMDVGLTRRDKIRNEDIWVKVEEKTDSRLR